MRQSVQYWPFTLDANGEATVLVLAQDFRHIGFDIEASSVTTGFTFTAIASNSEDRPDANSVASSTNKYSTVWFMNLEDGAKVDGDTGQGITADGFTRYEINDNNARWVWVKITALTDGVATVNFILSDNR